MNAFPTASAQSGRQLQFSAYRHREKMRAGRNWFRFESPTRVVVAQTFKLSLQYQRVADDPVATASGSDTAGFQRNTGFLAAAASSKRPMRVECGALSTSSGSSTASFAIDRMASMN